MEEKHHNLMKKGSTSGLLKTFGPILEFYSKKRPRNPWSQHFMITLWNQKSQNTGTTCISFSYWVGPTRKSKFQWNSSFMDVICFWLVRKDWIPIKETSFRVGLFTTISGKFFANYINIFYKTEVQIIILRCLKVS
jgi:hypothetical protein